MKSIIKVLFILFSLNQLLFSQTFEVSIQNQQVVGSELTFDIYILRTGGTNIYMGDCDFVVTFNHANFTNPTYEIVTEGLTGFYGMGTDIIANNRAILNIQKPFFSNQTQFNARVQVISNTGSGTLVASVKITGITNPSGTAGLQWRTTTPNTTLVTTLAPTSPWNQTNISANGTYSNPGDVSLPVDLTAFTAVAEADKIVLKWTTQSEVNNLGFEVYRSGEETGAYAMIASFENTPALQGGGNSNTAREYTYEDAIISNGGTYWYQIADVDYQGVRTFHGPVSAQAPDLIPEAYALRPNYPNPFNPETTIRFEVPADPASNGKIALTIYNNLGMVVRILVSGSVQPGIHTVKWDGRNDRGDQMASGVYFLRLQAGSFVQTQKMLLIR